MLLALSVALLGVLPLWEDAVFVVDPTGAQFKVERSALEAVVNGAAHRRLDDVAVSTEANATATVNAHSTSGTAHALDPTNGLMYLACVSLVFGWIFRKMEHFTSNLACCGHAIPSVSKKYYYLHANCMTVFFGILLFLLLFYE